MEYIDFFKQLFVLVFGVFVALVLAFYIIWPKIENYLLKVNNLNQHKALTKDYLQLKFAAYERLLLLVHRISPAQVMIRHHDPQLTVEQFRQAIQADIENEYQHNFTQQLYVSDAAWTIVKDLKERTISLLRNARKGQPENAGLDDYIAVVLRHVNELEVNPYDAAQIMLKKELAQ
ncbi:hypothetical protein G5B00_13265 [Parapedobacter sp. SGR-10]|uniref:DUF7935 family protein n=1 Tax=Parapedobacter sp. SGR-10 TaxID=2710879 RepID=UPI0013D16F71|nr:hypothetical protein [Parapedobacter sp. SGR-10]NGF57481.1 hypothetical protein [Parapedobacter sp. SGR-10]